MRDRGRVREHGQERGKNGRDGNLCVQKVSVSTGPARGNTVDGLPRAYKFLASFRGGDSESLYALKSNMGAGEISFFELTDYFWVLHPSSQKISQLNLQKSLRMCLDLQKGYSFSLVGSNLQSYQDSKSYQCHKILF